MKNEFIELFDFKDGQKVVSKGLFRKEDIYHIEIPNPDAEWVAVDLRVHAANWIMFLCMSLLAILVVGIPWFIDYCMGVYVKTEVLFIRKETYETLFNSSETN